MSEIDEEADFPILSMISGEGVISAEISGRYLDLSNECCVYNYITLNANELKMLSDELLRIAEILEGKK